MKKKRIFTMVLISSICFLLFTSMLNTTASAAYVYTDSQNVDNSTQETAFQLTENTIYDSLRLFPKRESSCFLESTGDAGWYKVNLSEGTKTLTIYAPYVTVTATVFNSEKSKVYENKFGKSLKRQGKFDVSNAGTYYIRISSDDEITEKVAYTMLVGAPDYTTKTYTKSLSTTKLTTYSRYSSIQTFDLSNVSSIPDSAIVKTISLGGTETNKYNASGKTRSICVYGKSWYRSTGPSIFEVDMFNATTPTPLKQKWQFQHYATSVTDSYSLKPSIIFTYMCENNY
ncbi:Hypothetical protein CM240_1365 [Clostridium bornimense]|uniref:Secreted protein n=1 Tax=Clostridium bornimense TaxID=1216932 RepID=W6RY24_9CLOT|nr:hypothetical protein [Clostridium bornimense]CDM68524.1 Hypothetical protein CM240_1365 [Clostridium bornimense]